MKHYEQVLNKITPTFYKALQYYDYYYNNEALMVPYLKKSMNIPGVYHIYFSAKNIHYYFNVSDADIYIFWNKTESRKMIMLTTIDMNIKKELFEPFVEFIINMVINKFGFKNVYVYNIVAAEGLNNIFIALVGKEMYETLRENTR